MGLQSLLAECLYLKGLPEESSHLAWYSDGSQITAAGGFLSTLQHHKTSCMDWIVMATGLGLKHLKWKGMEEETRGERERERESVSVTSLLIKQSSQKFKCQFTRSISV